ncbi:MAG: hypothetical protein KAW12_30715 [Candidatus Aminicenantes bacterium]|nr:hypothetical protein [Candidatus Aminicenantes bacterium]
MKKARILFLIAVLCLMGTSFLTSDVTLNVPECIQEHSNWCWAGASQALLYHYEQYPTQCVISNYAWSKTTCCGEGDFYDRLQGCNKANWLYGNDGSIEGILANWGVSTSLADEVYLTWNECVTELDNSQPFVIRVGWTSGGGHFQTAYGYITSGEYLKYMDPWPGEGMMTSTYTYVVSSSEHDWTHSLTTYQ